MKTTLQLSILTHSVETMASRVDSHQLSLDRARARATIRRQTGKAATETDVFKFLQTERRIAFMKRMCTTGDEKKRADVLQTIDKSSLEFLKRELAQELGKQEYDRLATMPLVLEIELPGESK